MVSPNTIFFCSWLPLLRSTHCSQAKHQKELHPNTSKKPILICNCGQWSKNSSLDLWGSKRGEKVKHLTSSAIIHIFLPTTEDIVKLQPNEIMVSKFDLRNYNRFLNYDSLSKTFISNSFEFHKKNTYNIFMKYRFSSSPESPAQFYMSIDGTINYNKEITLPVWEGELQSNALTVVVH